MSDSPRTGIAAMIAREWWLVAATVVVAGIIAFFASGTSGSTYVGTATVTVNQPAVSKYPTMLFGDRMLDILDSADFRTQVAEAAGLDAADVRENFRATATGKLLDRVNVRYTASSEAAAKSGTDALANGIVEFAAQFNAPEITRLKAVADAGDESVRRVRALQKKVGDNAFEQAQIETQLAIVEQTAITNRSIYDLARAAYAFDGTVSVAQQTGSRGIDVLAGALLAGLVAGLGLAALRERSLAPGAAA